MNESGDPPQKSLAEILTSLPAVRQARKLKSLGRVHRRILEIEESDDQPLAFQHSVFCQTSLPYRDPGDAVRLWQREQGVVSLLVKAGEARNPTTREWVQVGLPWGTKPRLILAHLNAEALRQQSPEIEVEQSLSAFVKRIRGFNGGREIRLFKDQLTRLSNSTIRLAATHGDRAFQVNTQVVTSFELWLEKDDRQRVLWPSTIKLSLDYFESLQEHAVPLNESDLAALAHSAMALDLYAWLAQRLHRITPLKPVFIQWPALMQQFGAGYGRLDHFQSPFRKALAQVLARYKDARIEIDRGGIRLFHSLPPVRKRQVALPPKSDI